MAFTPFADCLKTSISADRVLNVIPDEFVPRCVWDLRVDVNGKKFAYVSWKDVTGAEKPRINVPYEEFLRQWPRLIVDYEEEKYPSHNWHAPYRVCVGYEEMYYLRTLFGPDGKSNVQRISSCSGVGEEKSFCIEKKTRSHAGLDLLISENIPAHAAVQFCPEAIISFLQMPKLKGTIVGADLVFFPGEKVEMWHHIIWNNYGGAYRTSMTERELRQKVSIRILCLSTE